MILSSCASKNEFSKEKVCSDSSLKYLKHPANLSKFKTYPNKLIEELNATQRSIQLCYEDFRNRSGFEEFNTCLVVGIDHLGRTEFFNFSSKEIPLDETFIRCARSVTSSIAYSMYGKDYILVQSYQFFKN